MDQQECREAQQQCSSCSFFFFLLSHATGVADGVGGWAESGVDPSKFSWGLMEKCAAVVARQTGTIASKQIIIAGYKELVASKTVEAGLFVCVCVRV
jgi:serine/threonine protein phosphatase PrpC